MNVCPACSSCAVYPWLWPTTNNASRADAQSSGVLCIKHPCFSADVQDLPIIPLMLSSAAGDTSCSEGLGDVVYIYSGSIFLLIFQRHEVLDSILVRQIVVKCSFQNHITKEVLKTFKVIWMSGRILLHLLPLLLRQGKLLVSFIPNSDRGLYLPRTSFPYSGHLSNRIGARQV